jgi:hypothetical protein
VSCGAATAGRAEAGAGPGRGPQPAVWRDAAVLRRLWPPSPCRGAAPCGLCLVVGEGSWCCCCGAATHAARSVGACNRGPLSSASTSTSGLSQPRPGCFLGKQAHPVLKYRVPHGSQPRPGWAPDPLLVGIRSPNGLVVGSCTSHPGVLGSIPKREEPGKTGAPCVKVPGSSRVPRETEAHFTATGMSSQRNQLDSFRFKGDAFYNGLKSKVGLAAAKAAVLRVNLNVQGCGILAPPMHVPSRTPLLLPLLLSHNLPVVTATPGFGMRTGARRRTGLR